MKKCIQIIFVLVLIASFIPTATKSNAAMDNTDLSGNVLAPYIIRLQELNRELGTDYAIPDEENCADTGSDYNEVVEFYTSMTLDEFDSYIRDLYEKYGTGENYGTEDEEVSVECRRLPEKYIDEESLPDPSFQYIPWDMEDERCIYLEEEQP